MHPTDTIYFRRLVERNDSELQYMINNPQGVIKEAYKVAQYILNERKQSAKYLDYPDDELLKALTSFDKDSNPVRYRLIENEIKNRDFEKNVAPFTEAEAKIQETLSKNFKLSQFLEFRKRPDVNFKLQGETIDQYEKISEEDFKSRLVNPSDHKDLIVEDSIIRLYIRFDTQKQEYGYKLWYFDKYQKLKFKSVLHGISDKFAFQLISDFIEKGRNELQILKWKEVSNSIFRQVIKLITTAMSYLFGGGMFFLILDKNFLATGKSDRVFEFLFSNTVYFFGFVVLVMILSVIRDRHQLMNLRKLNGNEIVDTLTPLVMIPLFVLFLYFFWTSGEFN